MSAVMVLYLIDFITNLDVLIAILIIAHLIVIFGLTMKFTTEDLEDGEKSFMTNVFITLIILSLINVFIPSTKTMYMMAGAEYLNKSEIPSKVEKIINEKLDEFSSKGK